MNSMKIITCICFMLSVNAFAVTKKKAVQPKEYEQVDVITYQTIVYEISKSGRPADNSIKSQMKTKKLDLDCKIKYMPFADLRLNKETLGNNRRKSLAPHGLEVWLSNAQAELWEKRISNTGSEKIIVLQPKLTKLYAYPQGMNVYGVMGFTLDYIVDGKVIMSQKYRGFAASLSHSDAPKEYYDVLSYAAHDAMAKIVEDIGGVCEKMCIAN